MKKLLIPALLIGAVYSTQANARICDSLIGCSKTCICSQHYFIAVSGSDKLYWDKITDGSTFQAKHKESGRVFTVMRQGDKLKILREHTKSPG